MQVAIAGGHGKIAAQLTRLLAAGGAPACVAMWWSARRGRRTHRRAMTCSTFRGEVPREDAAAVIVALLPHDDAAGAVLYVNGGTQPVETAVSSALR